MTALLLALFASAALAQDPRYCGPPARDATGRILRDRSVLREFRKNVPCPSTGLTTGACPGWSLDHVWSLAGCGCDAVGNIQYLPNEIKSGPGTLPKDRWELRVYKCKPEHLKADRQ